jgi:hypothetical protein
LRSVVSAVGISSNFSEKLQLGAVVKRTSRVPCLQLFCLELLAAAILTENSWQQVDVKNRM